MSWLDEIRKRAEKATPGPWSVEKYYHEEQEYQEFIKWAAVVHDNGTSLGVITRNDWSCPVEIDLEFIAHAREDIPKLLDYIEKLHKAAVILGSEHCPDRGKKCSMNNGCEKCIMKYLNELTENEEAISDDNRQGQRL